MKAILYARYSTAGQSEASIDDQFRVCERIAEREGFKVVGRFHDEAISAGTANRPGYQSMLDAARKHAFEIIIAEDVTRLWRNRAEFGPRSTELEDMGVHLITAVGDDTRRDGWGLTLQLKQMIGESQRRESSYRTRRGVEGLARAQKPTGGRAYGYIAAKDSSNVKRQIDPAQAAVVVRIFKMYADGFSPRAIADQLNTERIPSPGTQWKRQERRRGGWLGSAIAGDASRGVGVLNNEKYAGRVIWGRNRWVRSAADSKRRRCMPNPKSEWITHIDESLRIVPEALWLAVKARQRQQFETIGRRVAAGLKQRDAARTGRGPKFLLSGLLKCGSCGAAYVMASATSYACASFVNGGAAACSNNARFRRDAIEEAILAGIRRDLATPEAAEEVCRRVRARLRDLAKPKPVNRARIAELETQIANLIDAVAAGGLRGSAGLAERLRTAEAELAGLKAQASTTETASMERLLPDLVARYTRAMERLPEIVTRDVTRGRAALANQLGPLTVQATEAEIRFYREPGHPEVALLRAASGGSSFYGSGGRI